MRKYSKTDTTMCPVNSRMFNRTFVECVLPAPFSQQKRILNTNFGILHRVVPPPDPSIDLPQGTNKVFQYHFCYRASTGQKSIW